MQYYKPHVKNYKEIQEVKEDKYSRIINTKTYESMNSDFFITISVVSFLLLR